MNFCSVFSRLAGILPLLVLMAAGCTAAQPQTQSAAQDTPQQGGVMQYASARPPVSLDYNTGGSVAEYITLVPVYEGLLSLDYKPGVNYNIDYPVVGWLAESWQQPDPSTYLFRLQNGVRWHDGRDLTADDVVFSYETLRDPARKYRNASSLSSLDRIEAVDKQTVKMTLKAPSPDFLASLADPKVRVMPKHVADSGESFEKVTIGTGPFKLQSFDRTGKGILARNQDYWRKGEPYLDGIKIIYGLEQAAIVAAFITQEVDLHTIDDKAQFDVLQRSVPDVAYANMPGDYQYSLVPKLDKPPFNDIRVRQAVHLAIDRDAMIGTLTFGLGVINPPAPVPASKEGWALPLSELRKYPGYRQPKEPELEEAKRLLREAGYPNGFKLTMLSPKGSRSPELIQEMAAGQLRAVGIEANLQPLDRAVFNTRELRGEYEMLIGGRGSSEMMDRAQQYLQSGSALNSQPVNDPEVDRLIGSYEGEFNQGKRKETIVALQRLLLDKLYTIPTVELSFFVTWQSYVKHYNYNFGAQPYLLQPSTVWMDPSKAPKRDLK